MRIALFLCSALALAQQKQPVDYVKPYIGSIGHLLTSTSPAVQYPHGMVRLMPITTGARLQDRYLAEKIGGFPLGAASLMAWTGEGAPVSRFDHDFETATPYYYGVLLEEFDVTTEFTATERAAYYRFTFPPGKQSRIAVNGAEVQVLNPSALAGKGGFGPRRGAGTQTYFYAEFSRPIFGAAPEARFATAAGERVSIRAGVSYISIEQARKNLRREIPEWGFEAVRAHGRAVWNRALGRIRVRGGTEKQRTIFYTALYRSLARMTNYTEDGRYYCGFDKQVHESGGHDFYAGDGLWDTYRSMHPLQLVLEPKRQLDMVRSYIRMYEQSGWLPSFPSLAGDGAVMIGHHAAALIADTYGKGHRDFDVKAAYAGMRKNATEATMLPWRRGPATELDRVYYAKGFFPALAKGQTEWMKEVNPGEKRQAVAVTLENCYDDWCVAQMAKALKKEDDYRLFISRARNYKNVYDARTGFMSPRTADGQWVEGFDPKSGGGQGGRDYFAECNSWIYTFHVQHDIPGLMELMGGPEKLAAKLDALFTESYPGYKFSFQAQFPDMTGLIGMYAQGNEPSFHIPYLYNYCGQPWKTQRRVRQIMDVWYDDSPLGICGDEDGGAMSSWYVLSAMGFYPFCPGRPIYEIGSPVFQEITIALENGKSFTVRAINASAKNKYVQSATLNGKPLNQPWFAHADLEAGASLVLRMGPRPNKTWGAKRELPSL